MKRPTFKRLALAERDRLAEIVGTTSRVSINVPEVTLRRARAACASAGIRFDAIVSAALELVADGTAVGREIVATATLPTERDALDPFEAIERARAHT
jgi:hypothetical protein